MLIDASHVPADQANAAVDYLCKAVEDRLLFDPHPTSALLAEVEHAGTDWLVQALHKLHVKLLMVIVSGPPRQMAKALDEPPENRCRQLEQKARTAEPGALTIQDYLEMLDCMMQKYLPSALTANEAKRQAVRQYLAGKLQHGGMPKNVKAAVAELPVSITQARQAGLVDSLDEARLKVAQVSAGRLVTDLTQATRSKLQKILIDAERARIATGHARYQGAPLQQALSDAFGDLNRDWRRVMVTETAMNGADGFLAATIPGEAVRWVAHPGACQYCESQHGKIFTVVPANQSHKDPETMVWPGKHLMNVGRAIAKRKRVEGVGLVERDPEELVVPAIPAHGHCRCIWAPHVALTEAQQRRIANG
jgi:hypothetical protein